MIAKWQQTVALLLSEMNYDFNTKITVVTNTTSIDNPNTITNEIWKECILEAIKDIPNTDGIDRVCLFIVKDEIYVVYEDTIFNNSFVNYFWDDLLYADGICIKIFKNNGEEMTIILVR